MREQVIDPAPTWDPFHGYHVGEFFDETTGYVAGYRLIDALDAPYAGRWADPDANAVIERMRRVYRDRGEAASLGRTAAERASRFTWSATVRRVAELLGCSGFHILDELRPAGDGTGRLAR